MADKSIRNLTTTRVIPNADDFIALQKSDEITAAKIMVSDLTGVPTSSVIINTLSDFPAPIGGIVTLAFNTEYIMNMTVNFGTNTIKVMPGSVNTIKSINVLTNNLIYVGTGALFTDSAHTGSLLLDKVVIVTPVGSVFDLADATKAGNVVTNAAVFSQCASMGTIKDIAVTFFFSRNTFCGQGLSLINNADISYVNVDNRAGQNLPGTILLSLSGNLGNVAITGDFFSPQSNEVVFHIDPASTTTGGGINVCQVSLLGGGSVFSPTSKDQTDPQWKYSGNTNIPDSDVTAEAYLIGNALTTNIPAQNAFVITNGTTWVSNFLERSTLGSDGLYTYTGLSKKSLIFDGNIALRPSNSSKDLSARFCNIEGHLSFDVTFTNGTNTINETETILTNDDTISFKNTLGTLPSGLRKDVVYYVVNQALDSFQVSYVSGGAVVAFTTDGSGTNTYAPALLQGSAPVQPISSIAPRDLVVQALSRLEAGDEMVLCVQNRDDAVDIIVTESYFRVKG